jgi:hypothetical protein
MTCPRTDCPIERTRKALADYRVENKMRICPNDHVMSCATCGALKGWLIYSDGEEREIPEWKLRGAESAEQSR